MFKLLELLGTDTGLDADHLLVMFDALPDARTRHASCERCVGRRLARTIHHHARSLLPGKLDSTLLVWARAMR